MISTFKLTRDRRGFTEHREYDPVAVAPQVLDPIDDFKEAFSKW